MSSAVGMGDGLSFGLKPGQSLSLRPPKTAVKQKDPETGELKYVTREAEIFRRGRPGSPSGARGAA